MWGVEVMLTVVAVAGAGAPRLLGTGRGGGTLVRDEEGWGLFRSLITLPQADTPVCGVWGVCVCACL